MFPSAALCNPTNADRVDAEFPGQLKRATTFVYSMAYLNDLEIGEFGPSTPFAVGNLVGIHTPHCSAGAALASHVGHVVGVSSEKQMIGPNTDAVVAVVTDHHSVGNWPVVKFPRVAMWCQPRLGGGTKTSVSSALVNGADPFPAGVCALDLSPESRFYARQDERVNSSISSKSNAVRVAQTLRQNWIVTIRDCAIRLRLHRVASGVMGPDVSASRPRSIVPNWAVQS